MDANPNAATAGPVAGVADAMLPRRFHVTGKRTETADTLTFDLAAPAPLQEAAVTALEFPDSYYAELQGAYTRRRDILLPYLESLVSYHLDRSYGDIAKELGSVARAVGQACGSNPIPILIPCHRVLSAGGQLGGFSGGEGLPTKRALLAHEGLYSLPLDL